MDSQVIHEHPLDFAGTDTGVDIYVCRNPDCQFVGFQARECQ